MNTVELIPAWRGEFGRWVLLCRGASRFGWREVGCTRGYAGMSWAQRIYTEPRQLGMAF